MRTVKDWKEEMNLSQTSRKSDQYPILSEKPDNTPEFWELKNKSDEAKTFTLIQGASNIFPLNTLKSSVQSIHVVKQDDDNEDVDYKKCRARTEWRDNKEDSEEKLDSATEKNEADAEKEQDSETEKNNSDTGKDDKTCAGNREPTEHSWDYVDGSSDEDDDNYEQKPKRSPVVLFVPVLRVYTGNVRKCRQDSPVDAATGDEGGQTGGGSGNGQSQHSDSQANGAVGGGSPPVSLQSWSSGASGSGDGGDGDRPRQEPKHLPDDALDIAKDEDRSEKNTPGSTETLPERKQTLPVPTEPNLLMEPETPHGTSAVDTSAATDDTHQGTSPITMATGLDGGQEDHLTQKLCVSTKKIADAESSQLLGPNGVPEAARIDDSPRSSLQEPTLECQSLLYSTPVLGAPPLKDPLDEAPDEGDTHESAEFSMQSDGRPSTPTHADFSDAKCQAKSKGMSRSQSTISGDSCVASLSLHTSCSSSSVTTPDSGYESGLKFDGHPNNTRLRVNESLGEPPTSDVVESEASTKNWLTEKIDMNLHVKDAEPSTCSTDQMGKMQVYMYPVTRGSNESIDVDNLMDGPGKTPTDYACTGVASPLELQGPVNMVGKDEVSPKYFMDHVHNSINGERSLMPQTEERSSPVHEKQHILGQGASMGTDMADGQSDVQYTGRKPEVFANIHETLHQESCTTEPAIQVHIVTTETEEEKKVEVDIPLGSLALCSLPEHSTRPSGSVASVGVTAQEECGLYVPATDGPEDSRSMPRGNNGARPKVPTQPNQDSGTGGSPDALPNTVDDREGAGGGPWRSPERTGVQSDNKMTILVTGAERSHDLKCPNTEGDVNYCLILQLMDFARSVMPRIRPDHRYDHAFGCILERMRGSLMIVDSHYDRGDQWMDIQILGRGGQGECSLCVDLNSYFKFAVKKIFWRDFRWEEVIMMLRVMNHVNTLQLYGLLYFNDYFYLIMEYLEGPTLRELTMSRYSNRQPLSLYEALHILHQLLSTLTHLWRHRVLHDDIKALNVVLRNSPDGTALHVVCLIDYGLAKLDAVPPDESPEGTAPYMSPEKAASKGHGHTSDVFAAMMTFLFMLQSFVPRENLGRWAAVYQMAEKGPALDYMALDLPEVIFDLLARGFHRDAAVRPNSEDLMDHPAFNLLDLDPNNPMFYQHIRPQGLLTVRTSEAEQRAIPDFPHLAPDNIPSDDWSDDSIQSGMDVVDSERVPNLADVDMSRVYIEASARPEEAVARPINQGVGVQCMEEESITSRYSDIQRPYLQHWQGWDVQVRAPIMSSGWTETYTSRGIEPPRMLQIPSPETDGRSSIIPLVVEEYLDLHPENEASGTEEEEEEEEPTYV